MGDSTHHEAKTGCTCTTCLLINTCGVPVDDPMWAKVEFAGEARVSMCRLIGCGPLIGSHGPWKGEHPWLQLWGRALNFDDGDQ